MGTVRVETVEVDGMLRAVAIPEDDATAEDWQHAWMEVRKLRDKAGPKGMLRRELAAYKKGGMTWRNMARTINCWYAAALKDAVESGAQPYIALALLRYAGIKRDAEQVAYDLEQVVKILAEGKWWIGVQLADPPADENTDESLRWAVDSVMEEQDERLEGVEETG